MALALFCLAAWIGSSIPRNSGWREPAAGVRVLVETNGTHTGLVVPIVSGAKDWRATFPELAAARGGQATHIGIGWGEREVFLDVPTWGELSPLTALRIASLGGASVMRVSPYIRPAAGDHHRPLRLTAAQYARLVRAIESSLPTPARGRPALVGTDPYSLYYEALGRYTLMRTCNSWTGDVLGDAGVRMGAWTPLAGGVTKWVDEPGGD